MQIMPHHMNTSWKMRRGTNLNGQDKNTMGKNKKYDFLKNCYDYLAAVEQVLKRVNKVFNVNSTWELRMNIAPERIIKRDNFELVYHGIGVRVSENNEEILDIETGMGIDICGIDPWGLYYFLKENILYYSFSKTDYDLMDFIKDELSKLLKVGKVKKISGLYFINDEKNREKLKKYKHNNK